MDQNVSTSFLKTINISEINNSLSSNLNQDKEMAQIIIKYILLKKKINLLEKDNKE